MCKRSPKHWINQLKVLINRLLMAILKLDRDRQLLNADVTWTQQFDRKSVEPVEKHVNKVDQIIIPEHKITSWMTYNHISLSRKEP